MQQDQLKRELKFEKNVLFAKKKAAKDKFGCLKYLRLD